MEVGNVEIWDAPPPKKRSSLGVRLIFGIAPCSLLFACVIIHRFNNF
jgi:hypothetical protein